MVDPETGEPHTAHTTNKVPAILVNAPPWAGGLSDGRLADIAPTVLELLGLAKPPEMTGTSLIRPRPDAREPAPAAHATAAPTAVAD